jgi:hypothetical protein
MRIRVVPDGLRVLATRWREMARGLDETHRVVQHAWESLDWEVRQASALEAQVVQARWMALALMEEAERLARFLEERAAAFEQADAEGTARLSQAFHQWRASIGNAGALWQQPRWTFPAARIEACLRLGAIIAGRVPPVLPVWIELQEQGGLPRSRLGVRLNRAPLMGMLKDTEDALQAHSWLDRVQHAADAWAEALRRYGAEAPQTQDAYGAYMQALIFNAPFWEPGPEP